ncbi:MAG: DUF2911 domain-containing protein [Flavobacteriales bacterium]|nr:DUF2911 domain-containing protein [Flavobacteriales bacterium]
MKKSVLLVAFALATVASSAQEFPAPSPKAKNYQMVGLTEMEVEYSRPGVKGRDIFGDLVPLDKLWRTGANRATKVSFSNDVMFAGTSVEAGTYAVFTIPMKDKIKVMLNSNANQGGTGNYDESLNVAAVEVPFMKSPIVVERMSFSFENIEDSKADFVFMWSDMMFSVPITVDTDAQVIVAMEDKMKEINGVYGFYEDAASYYLKNDRDTVKALEMAKKSVEVKEVFWNMHTLAKAYHANGDNKKAKETAMKSLEMSKEAEYEPYIKMNEKLISEL